MATDPVVRDYLAAGASWENDRLDSAQRSARVAWRISGVATLAAVASVGAVAALAPLKTAVPYVIRVDSSTGVVDVVPPVQSAVTPSAAVTRHLLHLYVVAKERYVADLAASDYALVGAMQSAPLNQRLLHDWDRSNPASPLNRYRDGTSVLVQIRSITFLPTATGAGEVAQVRFCAITRPAGGGAERQQQSIATLSYRYGALPTDAAERELNPLGLRVAEYQVEPEADGGPVRDGAP